jgi:hypothetical protein
MKRFPNKSFPQYAKKDYAEWPSYSDICNCFVEWQKHSNLFFFKEIGRSVEDRPILMAELTNNEIPDLDKQVAMFVACEHGDERNTASVALELIKWLLSPEGAGTLRKQRVFIVPVLNVDAYETDGNGLNKNEANLFGNYSYDGSQPDQPEAQALWRQMEINQPDLFVSLHGTAINFDSCGFHRIWESSAVSYSSRLERPYNQKIIDRINSVAEAEGYPMDRGAEDIERILPLIQGCEFHSMTDRGITGTTPSYCYNRFHSLGILLEVGSVRSGLLRCCEALMIGNERWEYECFTGYPNRIITAAYIGSIVITAGGGNASARRKNRCLLWQNSRNLTTVLGKRNPTCLLGFYSKTQVDFEEFKQFKNTGALLEYFEDNSVPVTNTLEIIGENWKNPITVWNDMKISKGAEEVLSFDSSLDTENTPMAVCMRFRIDIRTSPEEVLLNDRKLSDKEYRLWQDHRYKYLEVDIDPNLPRAMVLIKTAKLPLE